MGTRSLTHIKDEDGKTLVTIYRQFDGYPTGMGADIKRILGKRSLVNGYSDKAAQCNGMGCAAALLIGALKGDECGSVYVYPADSSDCWEDYTYTLSPSLAKPGEFCLRVQNPSHIIYEGPLSLFFPELVEEAEFA